MKEERTAMSHTGRVRFMLIVILLMIALLAKTGLSQSGDQPANDPPNPYAAVENWAKMPEGRTWGATSAVDIAADGKSVWVAERCGANTCAGSSLPVVLKFDSSGKLVQS